MPRSYGLGISQTMSEYRTVLKPIASLDQSDCDEMAKLYLAHYDGSDLQRFRADLRQKSEVILVYSGFELIGFTTLQLYERSLSDHPIRVVFSGDTVVDRAHWGQQALAYAWISRMGELHRLDQTKPMYWFLIVKGHRTFKYLPTFAKSFYPHWNDDRSDLKPLLDQLAMEKFGGDYNPVTGLVEYQESRGHLKADISAPSTEEMAKPSVTYFLARNPRYRQGQELCCICEIDEANMRPLTLRVFRGARQ